MSMSRRILGTVEALPVPVAVKLQLLQQGRWSSPERASMVVKDQKNHPELRSCFSVKAYVGDITAIDNQSPEFRNCTTVKADLCDAVALDYQRLELLEFVYLEVELGYNKLQTTQDSELPNDAHCIFPQ
ncbi:hypothetical protein EJB05_26163, partial [Eragrostis curvula]